MSKQKIIRVLLIIVGISFFITAIVLLTNIFDAPDDSRRSTNTLLISLFIVFIALMLLGTQQNKKYFYYMRNAAKKLKGRQDLVIPLEKYLGRLVKITTLMGEFYGTVIEVEGNFIKIKSRDMREVYHIFKGTMIISIKLK